MSAFGDQVGRAIRRLLRRHGWTQAELARGMKVSEPTVSKMVRGEQLTIHNIGACLDALGLDLFALAEAVEDEARPEPAAGTGPDSASELRGRPDPASPEQAADIRRRLRRETAPRPRGIYIEGVTETEFRSLLRRMVEDAVEAQEQKDRGSEGERDGSEGGADGEESAG